MSPTLDTRNRYIPPLAPTNSCGDWTPLLFVEETIGRRRQGGAGVKALPKLPVAGLVPVPDEEREVPGEGRVGDGDGGALVDIECAEPPNSAVEREGGEVGEGADLVLGHRCSDKLALRACSS